MESLRKTFIPVIILFLAILSLGTLGYYLIEQWTILESLYMTVITLTTVGFNEVRPLSESGRIFTIVLILLGVGAIAYGIRTIAEFILTTDLGPLLRSRRNKRMIDRMKDHLVVCGYGRVGRSAVSSLMSDGEDVVIIDIDEKVVIELRDQQVPVIHGDATNDEVLKQAGIERARGIIISGGSDTDNLYIVLSARSLNPELTIVTRSVDPASEPKMLRAGADRVISPYLLGGRFMANVLIRPGVTDFFQLVTLESGLELWLEELVIEEGSLLAGQTAVEADLRQKTGITLVGLLRKSTNETLTPDKTTHLEAADVLIALGTREQLADLEKMAKS